MPMRCILVLVMICTWVQAKHSVIPFPREMTEVPGENFTLLASTAIVYSDEAVRRPAVLLAEYLREETGLPLPVKPGGQNDNMICLIQDKSLTSLGREGYELESGSAGVVIRAPEAAGLSYGGQTLRQLLPLKGEPVVPSVRISDSPRFEWRAFMLDEGRYFKGEEVVKSLLDQMAALKMNVFHWHLVDDQGWRIEIKKYPLLTEVGSKRKETQVGGWNSNKYDGTPHEGFYTQEQILDIVAYAADRQITIVPEIEMPGHASSAVAAYPELGTKRESIEVPTRFGKHYNCFNAADENVYRMLNEILDEVVALFPGEVIHIGGDEVKFEHWKASEEIAELMKREGLKTPADVQIYFTNRISRDIEKKGRRMMGWNEILGDDLHGYLKDGQTRSAASLSPDAIIHFWKGNPELAERAVHNGHDVVNSWHNFTYLDYGYGDLSLQKAYEFDPIFKGLAPEYHSQIKGTGCQMWGEWIPTVEDMERQVYPRIAAYAEVGWTPLARKEFAGFEKRMEAQYKRWDELDIGYHRIVKATGPVMNKSDFFNDRTIAEWTPDMISKKWKEIEFKPETLVEKNGAVELSFVYNKGAHGIDIDWVGLLEDGKEISRDEHIGFSGGKLRNVIYKLDVPAFKSGATYTLQARIKGSGGTNSAGRIGLR
jgi:hexosaminidase